MDEYCITMMSASLCWPDLDTDVSACQRGLTMCYPAMFAVFTLSPPQLPRLEAVTVTVHQSAADSLLKKKKKKNLNKNKPSSEFLKLNCDFEKSAVIIYIF